MNVNMVIGKLLIFLHFKRFAYQFFQSKSFDRDPKIAYFLARCCQKGTGTQRNYEKAFLYYQIAAEEKHTWALVYLGQMYESGLGTDIHFAKAFECYRTAAELGNARAYNRLGLCYKKGIGVDVNSHLEVECYQIAADKGFHWGAYNLASCYLLGRGVERDICKAYRLLRYTSARKLPCGQNLLGLCFMQRDCRFHVQRGLFWYYLALWNKNSDAINNLGNYYYGKKKYSKAMKLYIKAAKLGNCQAIHALGVCYATGTGVKQDTQKALALYSEASLLGYKKGD